MKRLGDKKKDKLFDGIGIENGMNVIMQKGAFIQERLSKRSKRDSPITKI